LRVIRRLTLLLALLGAAMPAAARAQTAAPPPPAPGEPAAPAGPVAVNAKPNAILGRAVRFAGRADPAAAGRPVAIERFDGRTATWAQEASAAVAPDGTFAAAWPAKRAGRFRMRAVVQGGGDAAAAAASQEMSVTVYQRALATWYGPGFYRKRTACGQRMSRKLIGVAHRRLPCGTQVGLLYKGRTFVVPVVDRGPYSAAKWDLTSAAAKAIGFRGAERIGVVPLGPGPPPGTRQPTAPPLPIGGGVPADSTR
jgi:rare lipoprotein A